MCEPEQFICGQSDRGALFHELTERILFPPPSCFAAIPGPITRIGFVPALDFVYGMVFNPLTGALYAGFPSSSDAEMWTPSATGVLPVNKGPIPLRVRCHHETTKITISPQPPSTPPPPKIGRATAYTPTRQVVHACPRDYLCLVPKLLTSLSSYPFMKCQAFGISTEKFFPVLCVGTRD